MNENIQCPIIICVESDDATIDEQLIHFSTETGALFLEGMGDGIWLMNDPKKLINPKVSGRTYLETKNNHQFINNTSFSILQATRTRISKTGICPCPPTTTLLAEYVYCMPTRNSICESYSAQAQSLVFEIVVPHI